MRVNPFKPNSPVPYGMFAGRSSELNLMEKGLFQTKNDNPVNFLITGERGIGKSSLMSYMKHLAVGDIESVSCGRFNFITLDVVVSERTTLVDLVKLIEKKLKREISKIDSIKSFIEEAWDFVQRIKIMDSGIDKAQLLDTPDMIIDEFSYSLAKTCNSLVNLEKGEDRKDGIVLFLDETDNACPDLRIGYFLKTVTEGLLNYRCKKTMFVVAGLPEIILKLTQSHESSLRIFLELRIKELELKDRIYVIDKGIEEANKVNEEEIVISDKAKEIISTLSEGYPHFIQQFAFSAFETNRDGEISEKDVLEGAFEDRGALDSIGARYYASSFYEQIKSDEYRQVLSIMADKLNLWVSKKEIAEKITCSTQTLNNALQALTKRRIILKNSSKRGEYRLQQRGFALWIKLFGERGKK